MGTLFRKQYTKPLPANAVVYLRDGARHARWVDSKGKTRTAPITTNKRGADRVRLQAATFTAQFRDGSGNTVERPTGCRHKDAAQSKLSALMCRADKVRGGMASPAEDAVRDHQAGLLAVQIDAYVDHQRCKGLHPTNVANAQTRLRRLAKECGWRLLRDLTGEALEKWMVHSQEAGISPGNANEFRKVAIGFGNWCVKNHRSVNNPFANVPRADARSDPRRQRRAMTEEQLTSLLDVARRRPLESALRIRQGDRASQLVARVSAEKRAQLERVGHERALIYKTLVLTGLRKGELASLTPSQFDDEGHIAYLILNAADEKNRRGSNIPVRPDLAIEIRAFLDDRLACLRQDERAAGKPLSMRLPQTEPIFHIPSGLLRIFDRDLVAAGLAKWVEVSRSRRPGKADEVKRRIDKRDDRGRTLDIHALRKTFCTLMNKGGVAPRTAQAAMRHQSIGLTMNDYTDPKLLDVAGAMHVLPALPLAKLDASIDVESAVPPIACENPSSSLAQGLAQEFDKPGQELTDAVTSVGDGTSILRTVGFGASLASVGRCASLANVDIARHEMERTGVEPVTSALQRQRSPN